MTTRPSVREDSCRFPTFRLSSLAGYNDDAVVDDSLQYEFPRFSQYNGWLLRKRYLAWSPNSKTIAFLPGIPPISFSSHAADNQSQRRADGSLGRFDWTCVTQSVSHQFWRALCLRPKIGYRYRNDLPEYEFLTAQWESENRDRGHINEDFIIRLRIRLASLDVNIAEHSDLQSIFVPFWNDRPLDPSPNAIDTFAQVTQWAEAVDLGAAIQRNLKDKAAWLLCARRLRQNGWNESINRVRNNGIPPANDDFIGVWINGRLKNEALWLLSQGIPCFIAHRLDYEDHSLIPTDANPGNHEWWKNTDAELFHSSVYPYDFIALRNGTGESALLRSSYPPSIPTSSLEHHRASFPVNLGWRGSTAGYTSAPPAPSPPCSPSPMITPDTVEEPPTDLRTESILLNIVDLYADRVAWVKPPALIDNRGAGKWEKWVTPNWLACDQVGRKNKVMWEDYLSCLYDRDNRREIYFDQETLPKPPEGYVSDELIYGRPAPGAYFNGFGGRAKPSGWLYSSRYPEVLDMNNPIPIPPASALPLRVSMITPSPDEFLAGIAAGMDVDAPPGSTAQEGEDDKMDEVSLGSSEGIAAETSPPLPAPSNTSTFLRSSWFPLSVSWETIRLNLLELAEPNPDVHILKMFVTSTRAATSVDHCQALWVSTSTPDGADTLQRLFTGPLNGGPPRDLVLARKEEYDRAFTNATATWSPPSASLPSEADTPRESYDSPQGSLPPSPHSQSLEHRSRSLSTDARSDRSPTPPPRRDLRGKGKARTDHLPSDHAWWSNALRHPPARRVPRSPSPRSSAWHRRRGDRHWSPSPDRGHRGARRSISPARLNPVATPTPAPPLPSFPALGTPDFAAYVAQLVAVAVTAVPQAAPGAFPIPAQPVPTVQPVSDRPLASRLSTPRPHSHRPLATRLSNTLSLADRIDDRRNKPLLASSSHSLAASSSSIPTHSTSPEEPSRDSPSSIDDNADCHTVGDVATHPAQRRRKRNRRRADGTQHRAGKRKTQLILRQHIEDGTYNEQGYDWS